MEYFFKKKKMAKVFGNERLRSRVYGRDISKQIRMRLEEFEFIECLSDLRVKQSARLHKLKGNVYFAVSVSPNYRLIFEGYDSKDELCLDENEIVSINLIDVIDYH